MSAVALFVMLGTGCVLLFTERLNLRAHPKLVSAPGPDADLAPALRQIAAEKPEYGFNSLRTNEDPELAWVVYLRSAADGSRLVADVDPRTGEVLGYRDYGASFFRILLDLHYTLLLGTAGKVLSTLLALVLVLLSVTGFWLYRGALREAFRWRWGTQRDLRGRLSWLHRWLGVWSLALSLLWGLTGFLIMLMILPSSFGSPRKPVPMDPARFAALPDTSLLFAKCRELFPQGKPVSLTVGTSSGAPAATVRVFFRGEMPWDKFGEVAFDGRGQVLRSVGPGQAPASARYTNAVLALHFGFLGSETTWLLYVGGGAALLVLPPSGAALWFLRRKRRKARPLSAPPSRSIGGDTFSQ